MFRGKRLITYVITNTKHAPAYIDIEPEFLVCSFVFVLCVMKLTGLVDREGGVDVGVEVPGVDVGVMAEGGVHNV